MTTRFFRYRISGIRIRSQLELPLRESADGEFDATISFGSITCPSDAIHFSDHWRSAGADRIAFEVDKVARFEVRNGNRVTVDLKKNSRRRDACRYVLGSIIGHLLHQRGKLALHGSSIAIGDTCVAFLGRKGAGKSTLTALLNARGYPVVCDDIAATWLDELGIPRVAPGYPTLKLRKESISSLGHETDGLCRISRQNDKYAWSVEETFTSEALPLRKIYVLKDGPKMAIRDMSLTSAFSCLQRFTYRRRAVPEMGLAERHFALCSQIASLTPVSRFVRPRNLSEIHKMVDFLEKDFQTPVARALSNPPQPFLTDVDERGAA